MSLIIYKDYIEITIPNSEASIDAQHVGIKDRSVGSYYMSDAPGRCAFLFKQSHWNVLY